MDVQPPDAYYLLVSRSTYLPLISAPLKEHFSLSNIPVNDELYFKDKNTDQILKWNFPVGVLFDLLGNPEDLPWNVVVYFQGFPTNTLVKLSTGTDGTGGSLKSHYMNCVKEACFLKFSDIDNLRSLSTEQRDQLWEGLEKGFKSHSIFFQIQFMNLNLI